MATADSPSSVVNDSPHFGHTDIVAVKELMSGNVRLRRHMRMLRQCGLNHNHSRVRHVIVFAEGRLWNHVMITKRVHAQTDGMRRWAGSVDRRRRRACGL